MIRSLEALTRQIADLLRALAVRPVSLFCLLLAANAVALPYRNSFHDANLYGVQVLNRVDPGHYAGDLYFQYGSQDRYSVFSRVAAPLVACLGLPLGFFLLYVVSNALFLAALQRFVRAIVKDPLLSTLVLLFLAVTEIPFGGLRVFHVNEPFLTPRIAANALVLFALERLLAGRVLQAGILIVPALLLHPLMAFPGLLVILGWLALTYLRPKQLAIVLVLVTLATAALLLDVPLALRLFGHMDDSWRDTVRRVNSCNFPSEWMAEDWVRIVLSFLVILSAAWCLRDDVPARRLLITISTVAAVGLAGGVLVCFLPYALPLQGQPYRCLWILELSLYPLGFLIGQKLWASGHTFGRLAALGLLAYLNDTVWTSLLVQLFLAIAATIGILSWRGLSARPRERDWAVRTAILALGLAIPLWTVSKLGLAVLLRQQIETLLEPVEYLHLLTNLVDPLCWLVPIVLAATLLARTVGLDRGIRLACLAVLAGAYLDFFASTQSRYYSEHYGKHDGDARFVAAFLAHHETANTVPTIYWPLREVKYLWVDLRVVSYFHMHQVAGNLFNSGNASEGKRRARLVRKFELGKIRKGRLIYPPHRFQELLTIFEAGEAEERVGREDVLRLCREEGIDFLVLPQVFVGLYSASNGSVFIYDCRAIRASLEHSASNADGALSLSPSGELWGRE